MVVALGREVGDAAAGAVERHGLGAYDAVQLAAALVARSVLDDLDVFAAFDVGASDHGPLPRASHSSPSCSTGEVPPLAHDGAAAVAEVTGATVVDLELIDPATWWAGQRSIICCIASG